MEPGLITLFRQWLSENVQPNEFGQHVASEGDLWVFLNTIVLNDPSTVAIAGSTISVLWSHTIGDESPWTNQLLAEDLRTRATTDVVRTIGDTDAGQFLSYFGTDAGRNYGDSLLNALITRAWPPAFAGEQFHSCTSRR